MTLDAFPTAAGKAHQHHSLSCCLPLALLVTLLATWAAAGGDSCARLTSAASVIYQMAYGLWASSTTPPTPFAFFG